LSKLEERFWETKSLQEMNDEEWEALCDGCAQCCLIKFEHPVSKELAVTPVACELLDLETCTCTNYPNRHTLIEDCIELEADGILDLHWLPKTCGYRLIAEGKPLLHWHPLVSGDPGSVHKAGASIKDKAISERDVHPDDLERQFVRWVE